MEKGANISGGFSVIDKKTSSNSDTVDLMKMNSASEPFHFMICSMVSAHSQDNHLGRSFGGAGDDCGGGGGREVGPTDCSSGGANEVVVGNIYRRDNNISFSGEAFSPTKICTPHFQQPFDIFPSSSAYYSKTPVGGMAATSVSMGFPFTSVQWKELERQAMIYKYMISSVPVPHDLLFPLSTNSPSADASSLYNVRYSRNGDPEPGRCKRTDGKKWRCSREVAPHQKYCERHLHRGRPRSRKPVEVKNNGENHKKSRLEQIPLPKSTSQHLEKPNEPLLLFNNTADLSISTPSYKGNNDNNSNRDMGLMMESEMVGIDHQWQQLMESHMGLSSNEGSSSIYGSNASIFNNNYIEEQQPFNLFPYSDYPVNSEASVGFIDAWSIDNLNNNGNPKSSVSPNHGNLSPSLNLSMAMAAGNVVDEEMSRIDVKIDSNDCDNDDHKAKGFKWLSPVSWEPFLRGGPLAEALQPIGSSNPASPYDSMGSTPATTVSSPSGVLHRTPFSQSDSSVCNSPTFGAQVSNIRSCIPVSHLD